MFLQPAVGEQLSSVEFVQDYLQLHFDGPALTLFVWPVIVLADQEAHFGEVGYRNVLCARIGRKVIEVSIDEEKAIVIHFDDGVSMTNSLRPEDRTGPEAGYFASSHDPKEPLLEF
ncbi:MAG: hypothetical protein WB780_12605 [Candidatus Acidiferrales bacterium]